MAKVLDLPAIPPFSVTETSSLAQRWDKWTKSLDYYIRASAISDEKQKQAILLHVAFSHVENDNAVENSQITQTSNKSACVEAVSSRP